MANTMQTFQKNVTTSGTPVRLTNYPVDLGQSIVIKAKAANTGTITVGPDSASALNSDTKHFKLSPGDAIEVAISETEEIWIDSTVNGEGVEVAIG
jgi:hypothetical protein